MARDIYGNTERNVETQGPGPQFGSGGWGRHAEHGHRRHHDHGPGPDDRRGRSMRGRDEDGRGHGGHRRGPWAGDARAFGPGRRGFRGTDHGRPGGEGREAMMSLIAAARQVGRTGDEAQRRAARAVIDSAVRAVWSILAEGPATPPEPPAPAATGEAVDAPSIADGGDAAPATEA
jgi:hypothetical protein